MADMMNEEIQVWKITIDVLRETIESVGKLKGSIELFQKEMQLSYATQEKQSEILNSIKDVIVALDNLKTIETKLASLDKAIDSVSDTVIGIGKSEKENKQILIERWKFYATIGSALVVTIGSIVVAYLK